MRSSLIMTTVSAVTRSNIIKREFLTPQTPLPPPSMPKTTIPRDSPRNRCSREPRMISPNPRTALQPCPRLSSMCNPTPKHIRCPRLERRPIKNTPTKSWPTLRCRAASERIHNIIRVLIINNRRHSPAQDPPNTG